VGNFNLKKYIMDYSEMVILVIHAKMCNNNFKCRPYQYLVTATAHKAHIDFISVRDNILFY
jgi:hypothetical protein